MSSREYPKAWDRFERVENGENMKFVVEDVSEDMWSTAVEFMLGNYIKEDVWWSTAANRPHIILTDRSQRRAVLVDITIPHDETLIKTEKDKFSTANDPAAIQEYRVLLTSIVQQKMSVACFVADGDGSGHTLVGVNMCLPQVNGQFVDHIPPNTEAGLLSLRMFAEAMKVPVIYDKYGVGEYLMGTGLSVAPEYRRLGIATKLLTARMLLSKSLGFRATGGIFTSEHGQLAAEKAGYECLYTIPYKKFGKRCNINFIGSTQDLKIYATKTK